jgi:hypothetical protein
LNIKSCDFTRKKEVRSQYLFDRTNIIVSWGTLMIQNATEVRADYSTFKKTMLLEAKLISCTIFASGSIACSWFYCKGMETKLSRFWEMAKKVMIFPNPLILEKIDVVKFVSQILSWNP